MLLCTDGHATAAINPVGIAGLGPARVALAASLNGVSSFNAVPKYEKISVIQ